MTATQEDQSPGTITGERPSAVAVLVIILLGCLLFGLRFFLSPEDLMDNDQQRPAAYALDAIVNGNWIVQRDDTGDVMSKPPFSTWITAASGLAFGGLNRFSLYVPTFLASLAMGLMILFSGTRYFGRVAGWWAAFFYLCSPAFDEQIMLNRSDPMFGALVFGGSLAAFRALFHGKSWVPFWLLMTAATLTKGPLALLLGGGGVLVVFWLKSLNRRNLLSLSQWLGIGLFLLLGFGWFFAAYQVLGQPLIDKMIGKELVGHAVGKGIPGAQFYQPIIYLIMLLIPWSLLGIAEFFRAFRQPLDQTPAQAFQRFLVVNLLVGLLVFGLASHHRTVHLYPLLPMVMLLAGAFWARLIEGKNRQLLMIGAAVAAVILVGVLYGTRISKAKTNDRVIETAQLREIARELSTHGFPKRPIIHHTTPFGLQFFWGTMQPRLSTEDAAKALQGTEAAFVLTREPSKFAALIPEPADRVQLSTWPLAEHDALYLLSNQPSLDLTPSKED